MYHKWKMEPLLPETDTGTEGAVGRGGGVGGYVYKYI